MLRTFIQVTALSVVLLSSFFLIKGILTSSIQDITELATPKWNYNLDVAKNLTRQRSDTIVGFVLLLLSFILQSINLLWPISWVDFAVNKKGVIVALVVSILVFFVAKGTSNFLFKNSYKQVENILKKQV